jgi:DNA-binding XRE family transcriptional regulator
LSWKGEMRITGNQVRAARLLLGWQQKELAPSVRVSKTTISHFETGRRRPSAAIVSEIRFVLEKAGVEFKNGGEPGVELRKAK